MIFTELALAGAFRIDLEPREDARGFFARLLCREEFAAHGLNVDWPQMNSSYTKAKGSVRGLHFQTPPHGEVKLVKCLRGAVQDFIVDLRVNSPSFGQATTLKLTAENRAMIYVPKGFAHGFQTLTDDCELLYWHSVPYAPGHDAGVSIYSPALNIALPFEVTELSQRDSQLPDFCDLKPQLLEAAA